MNSSTADPRRWGPRTRLAIAIVAVLLHSTLVETAAAADEAAASSETTSAATTTTATDEAMPEGRDWSKEIWDAIIKGKPKVDVRARIEVADATPVPIDNLEQSEAYTIRTRIGYGTRPLEGISMYAEMENVGVIAEEQYWDVVSPPNGKTPIADVKGTWLNQAYLKIHREDLLDSGLIGGRQRIILDDSRFVGNVGWRQHEQTYDALRFDSSFGIENFDFMYGFIGTVRRIFGNKAAPPTNLNDWGSLTHLINARYSGIDCFQPTAFIYLLDLSGEVPGIQLLSSATFGLRATGKWDMSERWVLGYQTSYAYQMDYGNDPADYGANYFMADANVKFKPVGAIGAGYELLGSDNGTHQFVTPLATLHKFNGWADVFLNNGGVNGLQDISAYIAPKLPWKLSAKLIYHHFRSAEGNNVLGNEIDGMLKRPIGKYLSVMLKGAYFNASDQTTIVSDIFRFWAQTELKF